MIGADQSLSNRRWRELLAREPGTWPVSVEDWQAAASRALSAGPWGYIFGAAGSGATRDGNVEAFNRWQLAPHVLATPPVRDLSVTLLGETFPTPIFLAPVGVLSIAHAGGDLAVAGAARDLSMTMMVSTAASSPMETVITETPGLSAWYQLYWVNDRDLTVSFVKRATAAGYSALVVTVDTPMLGWRESDLSNAYSPFSDGHGIGQFVSDPVFRALIDFDPDEDPGRAGREMMKLFVNPGIGWSDIAWLRSVPICPSFSKVFYGPMTRVEHSTRGSTD